MQPRQCTALHMHPEILDAWSGEATPTTSGRSLDLAKAAKLLGDIKASEQEADLSGVDVIDAEQGFLQDVGQQVREQAQVSRPQACNVENALRFQMASSRHTKSNFSSPIGGANILL